MPIPQTDETKLALIEQGVSYIRDEVKDIKSQLTSNFLSVQDGQIIKSRLSQLEKVVYGFIGLILIAVVGAIMSLVLKK